MPGAYRHISSSTEGDVLVLTLEAEQVKDYFLAEELRLELLSAVKRFGATKIILDMRKLVFMTSLACVAFLGVKAGVRELGGRLVLCNMTDFIRKVFNAKRLMTPSQNSGNVAFDVVDSLSEAFQRLAEA